MKFRKIKASSRYLGNRFRLVSDYSAPLYQYEQLSKHGIHIYDIKTGYKMIVSEDTFVYVISTLPDYFRWEDKA